MVTFVAAAVQGTVGFGFSILAVPVLSLIDPRLAPVPQLLVSFVLSSTVFLRERRDADLRGALLILLGALPGVLVGLLLLKTVTARSLDVVLAIVVLVAVVVVARGRPIKRTVATKVVAGTVSGAFNLVSSIGGPPLALLYHGARGPELRGTLAFIFTFTGVASISTRGLSGEIAESDVVLAVWCLPSLLIGVYASRFLAVRVEGAPLRVATLVIASGASLGLIVRAITS